MSPLANGSPSMERRNIWRPIYGRVDLTAAAIGTKYVFDAKRDATNGVEHTNLPEGNAIGAGETFDVYGLRIACIGFSEVDLEGFLKNYGFTFSIGGRMIIEAPVLYYPGGCGISGAAATTVAATSLQAWTNGTTAPSGIQLWPPDLIIRLGENDKFRGTFSSIGGYTMAGTGSVLVFLDGVYTDPRR